jgi:hypothetical protein
LTSERAYCESQDYGNDDRSRLGWTRELRKRRCEPYGNAEFRGRDKVRTWPVRSPSELALSVRSMLAVFLSYFAPRFVLHYSRVGFLDRGLVGPGPRPRGGALGGRGADRAETTKTMCKARKAMRRSTRWADAGDEDESADLKAVRGAATPGRGGSWT